MCATQKRNYVLRPDGKPINVPRLRGQLFVCETGCCCGHTDRGFAPVPHDLYYEEWNRRKLRNKVHLNHAGCLGPCALANVAMLVFDGRPFWFHSLNEERLIRAIYDYIDAMLQADRILPVPAGLTNHYFNGFAWDGGAGTVTVDPLPVADDNGILPGGGENREATSVLQLAQRKILLLTHAETDLLTLEQARKQLPADFPPVQGVNLLSLPTEELVREFIRTELADVQVVVMRLHGGRSGFAHGFDLLVDAATRRNLDLICVLGTPDGLDPDLLRLSTCPPYVIHDVYQYLQAGGPENMQQMLQFLADHLLAGGWGYDQPRELPQSGIYRQSPAFDTVVDSSVPHSSVTHSDIGTDKPQHRVGILFYRSHWLSGNTEFVDALCDAIEAQGGLARAVYCASLKDGHAEDFNSTQNDRPETGSALPRAFSHFLDENGQPQVDVVLSTISFAMGSIRNGEVTESGWNVAALAELGLPIVQVVASGTPLANWRISARGLGPLDVAMNIALPEFDGRIISVPISFKDRPAAFETESGPGQNGSDASGPGLPSRYVPIADRVQAAVGQALRLAALRTKPNREKRVAVILTNAPGKTDRIGNAVGLDAPASLIGLLHAMAAAGYETGPIPADGDALIHELIDRCHYDEITLTEAQIDRAIGVAKADYGVWFASLSTEQQTKIVNRWHAPPGEAFLKLDARGEPAGLALAGLMFGNVFVTIQPPRGYGMDPDAIYHIPDLPPTHHYVALYKWLAEDRSRGGWQADAILHLGKHGTLEWLPGKSTGLSRECFPDSLLADLPLIYPFIINNPGEGTQAKRRAHAVIVDHMIPPMTSADTYGELALLTQLVDEYYQVEQMDPGKLPLVQKQIWSLMEKANLDKDIAALLSKVDHGDHTHEWDGSFTDDGTPLTLAEMTGTDFAHLLEDIDGYLCELGSLQIRDGLHTLGFIPQDEQLCHLLRALTRIANGEVPGLRPALAAWFGFDYTRLIEHRGQRLADGPWSCEYPGGGEPRACYSHADVLEELDQVALALYRALNERAFQVQAVDSVIDQVLGGARDTEDTNGKPHTHDRTETSRVAEREIQTILTFVATTLIPRLQQNTDEIENILVALRGGYVPAGPSGAPTRGMAHILPTGRNFYALDPRAVPSHAAWQTGIQLADSLLARYLAEEGEHPESVGISIWGTSAMRTHGDDLAQCLALLGVRPVWQPESRRVVRVEVIPLAELGRPRIDVLMRVSGFFRDAFPHLLKLVDEAVMMVANLDEPPEQNFVRKHYLHDMARQIAQGLGDGDAARRATFRLFGSKPGAYGAGILPLIHAQNWEDADDLARAYIQWGGYAYGGDSFGIEATQEFRHLLGQVQIAVKNQDNREHDIFDSDDYLQYHGGMIAAIRSINGKNPKRYFGDNSDPAQAKVRSLQEEAYRVFRSRVANPKWLESIRRHGYKGGLELSATVEYLFGYDATAQVVDDWMYEQTAQTYALDGEMQAFFRKSNPWALHSIADRLLEAVDRKMWAEPDAETVAALRKLYLETDMELERRSAEESPVGIATRTGVD